MTTDLIHAPWTAAQVTALNAFQHHGRMHPFTCGAEHASGQSPVLVATNGGWVCPDPQCVYRQDWAHAFMAEPAGLAVGLGVSATPSHTDLRQRIARVLTTTSRAEWPYTPGHEKWDHHKHGDQPGHTYSISCALCTGDVDRLADVLAAVLPPPADRAAVVADDEGDELVCVDQCGSCDACGMEPFGTPAEGWRQAAHFLRRTARESGDRAGALHGARLIEAELRRLADEAQQQEPESGCAHCGGDHSWDACQAYTAVVADAPESEPSVHGESVAHLAGLHGRRDQWADDEQADFVPPVAEGLPSGALDSARNGATMLDAWAEDPHGRNFLAHALVQLARDGWLRTEPADGFEPVRERDDVPEPQDPATLAAATARQDGAPS